MDLTSRLANLSWGVECHSISSFSQYHHSVRDKLTASRGLIIQGQDNLIDKWQVKYFVHNSYYRTKSCTHNLKHSKNKCEQEIIDISKIDLAVPDIPIWFQIVENDTNLILLSSYFEPASFDKGRDKIAFYWIFMILQKYMSNQQSGLL
jgi:hypothetical protein